jgi:hypothetical protein
VPGHFGVVFVLPTNRGVGMGHIGNQGGGGFQVGLGLSLLGFLGGDGLFDGFTLGDELLTDFGFEFAFHGLGILVPSAAELVGFGYQCIAAVVQAKHLVDVGVHETILDVGLHGRGVFFNEFQIQHGQIILSAGVGDGKGRVWG